MAKKTGFAVGTTKRTARNKVADDLIAKGSDKGRAFAQATAITQRASAGGQAELAKTGLKQPKTKTPKKPMKGSK
jgi:hypothetical protein